MNQNTKSIWSKVSSIAQRLFFLAFVAAVVFMVSPKAEACRDCPFPRVIALNKWLMPNGEVQVEIEQERINPSWYKVSVVLRSAATGDVLATGSTRRRNEQRDAVMTLVDRGGHRIRGEIRFVDLSRSMIQARFSCESLCSIRQFLD